MDGARIKPIVLVIRSHTGSREKPEMTRYERKLYFEKLMVLREAYRAETHEPTDMTIAKAMTFAAKTWNAAAAADAADAAAVATALTKAAEKAA
jgi:hypothetical protein